MLLTFPLITLSAVSIILLLVNGNYEVAYVTEVTSNSMPFYLKVTALWGGQSGSLVFWSWLMAAFASAVTLRNWDRDREFLPWVVAVSLVTLAFFLVLIIFFENPFDRLWQTSAGIRTAMFQPANSIPFLQSDGRGLNPLLRHPGMVIHPPMLYLGLRPDRRAVDAASGTAIQTQRAGVTHSIPSAMTPRTFERYIRKRPVTGMSPFSPRVSQ